MSRIERREIGKVLEILTGLTLPVYEKKQIDTVPPNAAGIKHEYVTLSEYVIDGGHAVMFDPNDPREAQIVSPSGVLLRAVFV